MRKTVHDEPALAVFLPWLPSPSVSSSGRRAVRFNPQENSRRGSRMTAQGSEVGIMNAPRAAHGRQLIGKVLKLDGNASGALYGPGISF